MRRWEGVPWIMKAGKALNERKVEIRVQYKPPAASIHGEVIDQMRNELVVSFLSSSLHVLAPALMLPSAPGSNAACLTQKQVAAAVIVSTTCCLLQMSLTARLKRLLPAAAPTCG